MRIVLTAEAREELRDATQWYAARSEQAARQFKSAYMHAQRLVQDGAEQWAQIEPGIRRVIFRKYPYSLVYTIRNDEVVVLAVKHHKRHPDHWRNR